ncbi:MAG: cytochrome c oxidase subunit II [Cytophaga sp.]|uniref:cytochrome c oxidase subunit II n=1 Tax=Cytophaga sp. TaxID=29535 RepID=UPI003F7FB963
MMNGRYQKRVGVGNTINSFLFVVVFVLGVLAFYLSFMSARDKFLPEAASEHGVRTDLLFWVIMAVLTVAFLLTNSLLYFFPYIYRFKEGKQAYFYPDNHTVERIWTIIPAVIMAGFVVYGYKEWHAITSPAPENSEVIEIMGKQFAWQVRYPGADGKLGKYHYRKIDATNEFGIDFNDTASFDDFIPMELHFPKGKNVSLHIRSRDVIHSVFLPHFRVKMDAVPGMPTKFWFKPTISTAEMREKTGNPNFNYELACTEVCGRGHYAMRFIVVVDEPAEYEKWKASQKTWSSLNAEYVSTKAPKVLSEKYLKEFLTKPEVVQPATPSDSTVVSADSTVVATAVVTKKAH